MANAHVDTGPARAVHASGLPSSEQRHLVPSSAASEALRLCPQGQNSGDHRSDPQLCALLPVAVALLSPVIIAIFQPRVAANA